MKNKKFFIIILALSAMVMGLSSCGSLGPYLGNRTANRLTSNYIMGVTTQQGGIIGDMIESATGYWYDEYSRCTISVTSRDNWYTVVDRNGIANVYYLEPLTEAVKCLPGGTWRILSLDSCRPTFRNRDKKLGWLIPTSQGVYKVINGRYSKIY